ncbi:HugZ family protein [Serratia microhaemolytica]|uniref:HugZ family pyridoxamine 5'-phosphate oxidase n=1 Tax=Serratia microhaemolytica TaxID=2675110 RepID=UPI001392249D|nr:pyridoxamine 5'-phosphate oxidase family protein [Serratia microhaemolytica]
MINKTLQLQQRISQEICAFRGTRRSLELASIDSHGMPHASCTPFVYQDGSYYILISELAIHGQNLKYNSHVGILLLDDEADTQDIFARRRLTYTAIAQPIERQSDTWQVVLSALQARAGQTVAMLSTLADFKLYRLQPITGRYVKGFGKAYQIDEKEFPGITPLDESNIKGHSPRVS